MEKDDPSMDCMLLQGVKFAFRIHQVCYLTKIYTLFFFILVLLKRIYIYMQFAGGFDDETMHAFVELKTLSTSSATIRQRNEQCFVYGFALVVMSR